MEDIKVSVVELADRKFFMMQYKCPINGKRISKSTKVERTGRKAERREAERVAAVWQADLQEGRYQSPSKMTWEAFRDRYDSEMIPTFRKETTRKIDTTFSLVEEILNPSRLRELTTEKISLWIAKLKEGEGGKAKIKKGETSTAKIKKRRADATVALYCRHLKSALNWAVEMGFLNQAPKFRFNNASKMKGRPVVLEEFERINMAVPKIIDAEYAPEWLRFLDGLWESGFRLSEALALSWEPIADVTAIVQAGSRTVVRFKAAGQKGKRDELWPCPPEFARLLEEVPEEKRTGPVFKLQASKLHTGKLSQGRVAELISKFSKKAGVFVDDSHAKPCTAHDLRRAFGTRWSRKVMPAVLQRLMRHRSIDTTMKHYVSAQADDIADLLYQTEQPEKSNTFSNTSSK